VDTDALAYIAAVEIADAVPLHARIKTAINDFVVGCKADGTWTAIKSACFLAGPATLNGALVPLVGTAPTNVNFVSGDYNSLTGVIGNGSTKYLNSNRASNTDTQNDVHQSVWIATAHPSGTLGGFIGNGVGGTGSTQIFSNRSSGQNSIVTRSRTSGTAYIYTGGDATGFIGHTRSSSANFISRVAGASTTTTATSEAIEVGNSFVFARNSGGSPANYTGARIAFYSVGANLDLALLESRLSTYMLRLFSIYKYPSLRTTAPVAGYYARLDAGAAATDQFTADGAQDGTLTNGATRADDSGLAYSFDGTDDYVSFGINAFGSGLNGATAISFAAWIKYTALIGAANQYGNVMFSKRLSLDVAGIWLNIRSDVGQSGKLLVGGRSRSSDAFQEATSTQVIAAGSWTHIAGVLDYTAKTVTTYINGVATAASSLSFGSNTYTNSTGTIVDAMGTNTGSIFYQGLIDDAIIFSIGLSSTQIGYLASQRGAIYALASAGGSLINGQSLIRPADSKPYQQLIGV
jgi:hypothetical protein